MTDNRINDQEIDPSVRDGLRVLGLIDDEDKIQPSMPNLPPELPSAASAQYPMMMTRIGTSSR